MRSRTKLLAAALSSIVLLLAAAPWLLPLSRFIPLIEARAQERLDQPVRVGRLQAYLLPWPRLVASDIAVGERGMLRIDRLSVTPSLWDLFADVKQIEEVRAEGVVITREALRAAPGWRKPPGQPRAGAEVRHVTVRDAQLQLGAAVVRDLGAEVELDAGAVRKVVVHTQDDRLKVTAIHDGASQYRLGIAARNWQVPVGPPIVFQRLDASALLTDRAIDAREVHGVLYGGSFKGAVNVAWKPLWSVSGTLAVNQVDLRPLSALFTRQTELSGLLTAAPRFSAQAREPGGLIAALALQSGFTVEDGVLQRVDLHAAAHNPLRGNAARSGVTRFSQLSGELEIDRDGYHFDKLKVATGLLSATGEVSIARDQTLSGYLEAAVSGTGDLMAVPLKVSGSLQNPSVAPTRTAVAAVVAGSVLLPGIGTAVGLKASQLTARLFGGSRRRSDTPAAAVQ